MRFRIKLLVLVVCFLQACKNSNFQSGATPVRATQSSLPIEKSTVAGSIPNTSTAESNFDFPTAEEVAALREKCQKAGPALLKSSSQVLNYPEKVTCNWDKAPNLQRKNGFVQAVEVSSNNIMLPEGDICEISIQSAPNTVLTYDDFLVLTIDNRVIFVSNNGLIKNLSQDMGYYAWDFKKVVGQRIENFLSPVHCIGAANTCVLPATEKEGPVALNLTPAEFAPIAASFSGKKSVPLDLTATGDDNNTDCGHTALSVTVQLKYLP